MKNVKFSKCQNGARYLLIEIDLMIWIFIIMMLIKMTMKIMLSNFGWIMMVVGI